MVVRVAGMIIGCAGSGTGPVLRRCVKKGGGYYMEMVSWAVVVPVVICTIIAQGLSGIVYAGLVWPRVRGREFSKLMALAFCATTLMVLAGGLIALVGRQSGDVVIAFTCALMWVGQMPFMFAGLPILEYWLSEQRRVDDKARELAGVRDGQA